MTDSSPDTTRAMDAVGDAPADTSGESTSLPPLRPLLDLIPGMPSGQVCGPDGCAPAK